MDATIPLQCMVDESCLVIKGGESKAWLSGFYDPCLGEKKQLCVRYMFWGRLHEVVINDDEQLKIPQRAHLLGTEVTILSDSDEQDSGIMAFLTTIWNQICRDRVQHRLLALSSAVTLAAAMNLK